MPGDPNSPYPNIQKPYVRWQRNGQALDADGNVVPKDSPEAHIPAEEFEYKPERTETKMNEHALREMLVCLRQLGDLDFQQRVWVRGEGPEVSSYAEVVCQLFDDTGLGDLLESGDAAAVLGSELADELLRLQGRVDALPAGIDDPSLLRLPAWRDVMDVARAAHTRLAESMRSHRLT